jgi:hypothetical protein
LRTPPGAIEIRQSLNLRAAQSIDAALLAT